MGTVPTTFKGAGARHPAGGSQQFVVLRRSEDRWRRLAGYLAVGLSD
jgi:hypothetical protein